MQFFQLRKTLVSRQILLGMKLLTVFLFLGLMQVSARTNGQNVSISGKNISLEKVFKIIKKQSEYVFFYDVDLLKKANPVTIDVTNQPVETVLKQVFHDQPFTWSVQNKTITVVSKPRAISLFDSLKGDADMPVTIEVQGVVTDENGKPLVGVTVMVKNSKKGTQTDRAGNYVIENISENAELVFSSIGYVTQEVSVNGRKAINVQMKVALMLQQEIVIASTGYQNIPKERATGSFSFIRSKDIQKRTSNQLLDRLEGQTSGLLVNTGQPDRSLTQNRDNFMIRGVSTINSEKKPLIVVDGFPTELDLVNIDPESIENITVLKDAAAASIWGVRSANGVLVIQTKKARSNKVLVEFSSLLNITSKPRLDYLPILTSKDFLDVEKELVDKNLTPMPASPLVLFQPPISTGSQLAIQLKNGEISSGEYLSEVNRLSAIDVRHQYQNLLLQNPFSQTYNLAVSGGSDVSRTRMALSYSDEYPNAIGDYGRRFSVSLNNQTHIGSKLTFSAESFISTLDQKNNGIGLKALQPGNYNLLPYDEIADESGNGNNFYYQIGQHISDSLKNKGFLPWNYNFLDELKNADNNFRSISYRFITGLKYDVVPALNFELKYMFERGIDKRENYYNPQSYYARNLVNSFTSVDTKKRGIPEGGILALSDLEIKNYNLRAQLNFIPNLKEPHDLVFLLGAEIRENSSWGYGNTAYGYDARLLTSIAPDYGSNIKTVFGNRRIVNAQNFLYAKDRYISAFANANYTFKGKYAFSGSIRKDDSNLFGASRKLKTIPLWSLGALWRVSDEKYFSGQEWLNSLTARVTFGYNGNVNKTTSPYLIIDPKPIYPDPNGNYNSDPYAVIYNPSNPLLQWEKVGTLNLGVDFAMINNRINGKIDVYWRKSQDLLGRVETNPTYGFTSILANQLEMQSRGIDVELQGVVVKSRDFSWVPSLNWSFNKNKVTKTYFQENTLTYFTNPSNPIKGHELGSIFTYKYAGLNDQGNAMIYDGKGKPVLSDLYSMDETNLNALSYQGGLMPKYYGGFSNIISYKNFELYFLFTFKAGHKFIRPTIDYISNLQFTRVAHSDWARRWKKPGDESITDVPAIDPLHIDVRRYYQSDLFIENASYIRWRDISLTYSVPIKKKMKKVIESLSLSLSAKNLTIWTANRYGIDPDYIPNVNTITLPPARSFAFMIRAKF